MTSRTKTRDPFANTEIRASAGTGKTYSLSIQFIGLLDAGVPVDQILATTFTRKAAGEITGRLFERLAKAVLDAGERATLATNLGKESLDIERCRELLLQLTRDLHRIRVGTLDSYFAQVARSYCFEMGLPPDWSIIVPVRHDELVSASIEEVMRSHLRDNPGRLEHLLPFADSQRSLSKLVRDAVTYHYSLYRDTTQDCWSAVKNQGLLSDSELTTLIESIREAPFPEHQGVQKTRNSDLDRFAEKNWERFLTVGIPVAIAKADNDSKVKSNRQPIPAATIALYRRLTGHAVAVLLQPVLRQTAATFDLLDHYHNSYFPAKHQDGSLTFNDVTFALHDYLAQDDSLRPGFRLDATVEHLLLDEFQDTSLLQWNVLLPLAKHVTASTTTAQPRSFFCVGDTKQAIFGWRGGRREIFDAVNDDLDEPLEGDDLTKSYRSAQPIMDAVNHVFTNLTNHPNLDDLLPAIKSWQAGFPLHTTVHKDLSGGVEFLHVAAAGCLKENLQQAALDSMAETVKEISKHAPAASIGVLTRVNDYAHLAIQRLRSEGLDVSGEGGVPLDDTSPNQAILSLLTLLDHPGDQVAHYHVAHSPLGNLVGLSPSDNRQQINGLTQELRHRIQHNGYGPFIERLGAALVDSCSQRQRSRLDQLVDLAYTFQPTCPTRTFEFREHVRLTKIENPTSARIRVMTVHGAKGLEFDAVVLPEMNVDIHRSRNSYVTARPHPTSPVDKVLGPFKKPYQPFLPPEIRQMYHDARDERITDALCVLYVALTRAKHGLYVILPYNPARKSFPKTLAGLVETAINAPLTPDTDSDTFIPGFGNSEWFHGFEPAAEKDGPKGACGTARIRQVELSPGLTVPGPREDSRPEPITPSSMEGEGLYHASDFLQPGRHRAMARGTLIHGWLEHITWFDEPLPSEESMKQDIQREGFDESAIAEFHEMLKHPQVARIFDRESYMDLDDSECNTQLRDEIGTDPFDVQAYQEFPLCAVFEDKYFNGIIDRLVLLSREGRVIGADIIDFKTDQIDPDDPELTVEARSAFYQGQLNSYAQGLSASLQIPLPLINTRLAFVGVGVVTRVDHD
jgi:ATP-dependent helicase/nuclease subunit A